jgi:hypothetical protein
MKVSSRPLTPHHVARCRAQHSAEGPRQMCAVSKSGRVCRVGDRSPGGKLGGRSLNAQPQNIGAQGNSNGIRKQVHQAGWRQVNSGSKMLKRKILKFVKPITEDTKDTFDSWI